ncbi:HGxxPAAW family protein [Haematomicrobium sanguinis]|uniref:HGxxPAAW family protein n=1 Tax=Haematomicrobium sanguinis TaxID=479106 RepID=UPI00047897F4|nr:HGxxPAAW family protein [Haematomicrobium sanguinis]
MANNAAVKNQSNVDENKSIHDEPLGHGSTPAAWACVTIMIIGVIVSCIGFIVTSAADRNVGIAMFWAGLVVVAIGLIVGWIMRRAGYGVGGDKLKSDH